MLDVGATPAQEYCCGYQVCIDGVGLNEDFIAQDYCMPVTDHGRKNMSSDGRYYCTNYCKSTGIQCLRDNECESALGENYCCGSIQNSILWRLEGPQCIRRDLPDVYHMHDLHYSSCINQTSGWGPNACASYRDCYNN